MVLNCCRSVHAARPELPIILITGHPEMLNRLPPIGPGHYRLFKKPFDGQELLTAVSDALLNRQRPRLEAGLYDFSVVRPLSISSITTVADVAGVYFC